MTEALVTFLGDDRIGELRSDGQGRSSFRYDEAWRRAPQAIPLSLSMPLAVAEHGHRATEPFLWGLLPDNEVVIERWARRFQVSARNAFALLAHVGEECAGAVRFVSAERAALIARATRDDDVAWLDEADVAERLRALRTDAAAWHRPDDQGYFSLAGAQPKIALYSDGTRYGIPSGRGATTHILKPDLAGLVGHSTNEHVCLDIARAVGIPTARSRVVRFVEEVSIVVQRYDRVLTGDRVVRAHQEDLCQALAIHPAKKYEAEGGPSVRKVAALLRESSRAARDDVMSFVRALALNWLIGGTDAHGKNYSLLLGPAGRARLAPLYDVASVLPYANQPRKLKLAMKIGGKYRIEEIGVYQWSKIPAEVGLELETVRGVTLEMSERLPDVCSDVVRRARREGLEAAILDPLQAAIAERARRCHGLLAGAVW